MASRLPALDASRVRGIVFDLDGTLIDSYAAIADSLNYSRAHHGLPPLELAEVRRHVGHGLEALVAELVGPDRVEHGVKLFRERYAEVYAPKTRLLPGVRATLRTLAQRGYRMTVASNKPARFSERILDELGLRHYLRSVQGPDRVGATKPDPAMIRRCLADLSLAATEAIYVGDMVLDVETAARAGLPVVLVTGGSSSEEQLRATGQLVIASFDSLLAILPHGA